MNDLERTLRIAFPNVDIRSDQCTTIRLITQDVIVGCEKINDSYQARVTNLKRDSEFDFDTELIAEFIEHSPEAVAARLAVYL